MRSVFTKNAPEPIGPYSQAVVCEPFIFISGQIPLDPKTGKIAGDSLKEQTSQVLKNIISILNSESLPVTSIVKTTVFLKDISKFSEFNEVYEHYLEGHKPARSTVEVSRLPKDVLIEIEAVACR